MGAATRNMDGARSIVLVDGDCVLCSGFVTFVAARDRRDRLRFAAQQSEEGQILLKKHAMPMDLKTIVVVELDEASSSTSCFTKSSAVLRTMRHLDGVWVLLCVFMLIPCCVRDFCYDLVASNRYRLFGKIGQCSLPPIQLRKKITMNQAVDVKLNVSTVTASSSD